MQQSSPHRFEALRQAARTIFDRALAQLDPSDAVARKLHRDGPWVRIGHSAYDLRQFSCVLLVAVGKAAVPMAAAVTNWLDPALHPGQTLRGVVVGTSLPASLDPRLRYRLGSHPLPDQSSIDAAQQILDLLQTADTETLVFFLVSGGASAMVEWPISPDVRLPDLVSFYRALVHSGLSIVEMNTLRKHLSRVKGGRLAVAAGRAQQCTLLISDVPPAHPEVIGSGLSMPDETTLDDCRQLLETRLNGFDLPASVRDTFYSAVTPETPKRSHPAFAHASFHTLLSSEDLCTAAAGIARNLGFEAVIDVTPDEWSYTDAAEYLLARVAALRMSARPVCLITAGELSVQLSGTPGAGGRNQQFALECARRLKSNSPPLVVLSAGSDGIDGNSPVAGAIVDSSTCLRARKLGFSVEQALAAFNAFPFLHALRDTIVTGPTGNNLRDLRLFLFRP